MSEKLKVNWHAVSIDGYPEHNVGVLVFIPEEDYHVTTGMWDVSNKWVLLDEYRTPKSAVTHWTQMPEIPEQYAKERQETADTINKFFGRKIY